MRGNSLLFWIMMIARGITTMRNMQLSHLRNTELTEIHILQREVSQNI
jgi:hypothetical protein